MRWNSTALLVKAIRSSRWNARRREVDHPFAFRVDGHQRGGLCVAEHADGARARAARARFDI